MIITYMTFITYIPFIKLNQYIKSAKNIRKEAYLPQFRFIFIKKRVKKASIWVFLSVDASIYCADVRDKKLLMSLEEIQGALENIVTQIIE